MFNTLTNVIVDKISLVTKSENPAVPKATTKFALFKTKPSESQKKLEGIVKTLENDIKLGQVITKLEDGDYLDIVMGSSDTYSYNEDQEKANNRNRG